MKKILIVSLLAAILVIPEAKATENNFKWLNVIDHQMVRNMHDGLVAYLEAGKWGFVDKFGKTIISAQYEEVSDFSNGLALVKKDGKYGVIKRDGSFLYNCIYDELSRFSDGFALAVSGNTYYYLNETGSPKALSNEFSFGKFSDGVAKVKDKKRGKWGYVDTKGVFVIEPKFDEAYDFSGGLALVKRGGDYFLINKKGSTKTSGINISKPLEFRDGYAIIEMNDKYTFISNADMSTIPIYFTEANPFSEGMALVKLSDELYYIKAGSKAPSLKLSGYKSAGDFSEGRAWVRTVSGKYGYIDQSGSLVIDTIFSFAGNFSEGVANVAFEGRPGFIQERSGNDADPKLSIGTLVLKDASGNKRVEVEESFTIEVPVSNRGKEVLRGVSVTLSGSSAVSDWFSFDNKSQYVDEIKPGEEKVLVFSGQSNTNLESGEINLNVKSIADNILSGEQAELSFDAMGIAAAKPTILKYWVYKDNHSVLRRGDNAKLEITVKNEGKDIAKDVVIDIIWPYGVKGETEKLRIASLNPNDTRSVVANFVLENDSTSVQRDFSIVVTVSDFAKKSREIKYLAFESDKLNMEVNLQSGQISMPVTYMATNQSVEQQSKGMSLIKEDKITSELLEGLTRINPQSSNRYALVIGNEDYNTYKQTVTYEQNVDFAVQDAVAFAAYAENILGIPESNIILLKNATYAQINFNLNKITRMCQLNPDQVELYVYYAGHGQHDADTKETYLIPVDVSISAPSAGFKLEQLYTSLSNSKAKRTMVFLDACYSGVGRGIVIRPKEAPVAGNLVVFTASSSTQRSMPYHEKKHGMFTYYLLKTLKDTQGRISIDNLFNDVRSSVVNSSVWINNTEQTPEIITGTGINSDWKNWTIF